MLAITVASLRSTFKSPQSIFFGLFFPIVLIVIFGALGRGGGGGASVDIAFEKGTDTTSLLYKGLLTAPLHVVKDRPDHSVEDDLRKGRISAILGLRPRTDSASPPFEINIRTSKASMKDMQLLNTVLKEAVHEVEKSVYPDRPRYATITQTVMEGREYRMIDFFLPGMIGFSLIGSAVFSVAFVFFSMRETLVLKRLYSTPIRKSYIILGESLSRVLFQMMVVLLLIAFGHFFYRFYLSQGVLTVLYMLFLSFLALLVFMGFGFFVSSVARNQNVIPIYANLFMFPQYFLSGTFFSREALPGFLQPVIKFLPLTALNDAMRNVAFEGAGLGSCLPQIAVLLAWGLLVFFATVKVFRWE
ncbi:hypothetical protein GCM10023184_11410 [Flaviaesturariibacter amylovorans]|uniref:Transport permease protein n=2 Tax=Flaviaesturariibacter amylovorans TaxID=1084520 RepID=A0ABP8GH75_9BACT